jgi:hypothetical protein
MENLTIAVLTAPRNAEHLDPIEWKIQGGAITGRFYWCLNCQFSARYKTTETQNVAHRLQALRLRAASRRQRYYQIANSNLSKYKSFAYMKFDINLRLFF